MIMQKKLCLWASFVYLAAGCGSSKNDDKSSSSGSSYSFESEASSQLLSSSLGLRRSPGKLPLVDGPSNLCETGQTISCAGVSDMSGKLLTVGLLIQAGGQGMQSYLLTDNFSDVTGDSTAYDFDFRNPVTTSGALGCCGGTGDLSSENAYFSDANFLFGYIDASFKIPYVNTNQVNSEMLATHTVRFVLADKTSTGYKRGDLLLQDSDDTFKWMTSDGTLSATRPASPITMDTQVVNYTNPFDKGNTEIPVIASQILSPEGGDNKVTTSEDELKETGNTYRFDFDASSLIVFMLAPSELTLIQTKADMLKRIHLQGLPHSKFTFGASAVSTLTVTNPNDPEDPEDPEE
jgi:hypothetical protein